MLSGDLQAVDVPRDSGGMQRIYRCPNCQIALFSEYTYPKVWFVRAGTLDESRSVTPDVHIFTRSKVDWVRIPESVAAFDVFYKLDELWPSESSRAPQNARGRLTAAAIADSRASSLRAATTLRARLLDRPWEPARGEQLASSE